MKKITDSGGEGIRATVPDTLPEDWTELVPPSAPEPVTVAVAVVAVPAPAVLVPARRARGRQWDPTDVLCAVTVAGGVLLSVSLVVLVVVNWSSIWPALVVALGILVALGTRPVVRHCPGAWHR